MVGYPCPGVHQGATVSLQPAEKAQDLSRQINEQGQAKGPSRNSLGVEGGAYSLIGKWPRVAAGGAMHLLESTYLSIRRRRENKQ